MGTPPITHPVFQEVADDGREKVRYKKESGTYCLLWLMRCIMFNVTLVDLVVDGKRRVSFLRLRRGLWGS